MMKTDQIRKSYLEFFASKQHVVVPSDSLVPANDPTLLFTGAGMNQFKEYFLGLKKDMKRAVSSQKCLRTGDLDEVGRTAYHHSFFEMLGNFSFGDYFKKEAIEWAWEFLTRVVKIDSRKLRISVHQSDGEAYDIWRKHIGVRGDFIERLGDKSNFWPSNAPKDGPNGPSGPCSEIYFDYGNPDEPGSIEKDSKRFAEIWNLVFTQFNRQDGGVLAPLANKNIDTGMGLERLACVLQGKTTNFEIDIFEPINKSVCRCLKIENKSALKNHLYAVSDHVRAVTFLLSDGVFPTNEGRGYVARKLIRRALWHGLCLSPSKRLAGTFLHQLVPVVADVMKTAYPDLMQAEKSIASSLKSEEERFLDTLGAGLKILEQRIEKLPAGSKQIPGDVVFELYDTYGFPDELTRDIAEEKNLGIDMHGFQKQMNLQRERAKKATKISGSIFVATDLELIVKKLKPTRFVGYDQSKTSANVLYADIKDSCGVVVLDQTPFYAESGGQVGDTGVMISADFRAVVMDTKKIDQCFIHHVRVEKGRLTAEATVDAEVDMENRKRVMRNHTATHLLHAALRKTLGAHVRQLGSLVSAEKLRFDYSHPEALSAEQIAAIEALVNTQILQNLQVSKEEKPLEEAKRGGAIAFFGEKYGQTVRVVTVPGFSQELCGGTHCGFTGDIGSFVITQETSIASGTRRIEALTGDGALAYYAGLKKQQMDLSLMLKTNPKDLTLRVGKLQEAAKKAEKTEAKNAAAAWDIKALAQKADTIGKYQWIGVYRDGLDVKSLREASDLIRSSCRNTIYLLAGTAEDKNSYVFSVSGDLKNTELDLRKIWENIRKDLNASGGGRKDMIQGGGPKLVMDASRFDQIKAVLSSELE